MYETIGSPVTLGNVTLKNRIVLRLPHWGGLTMLIWRESKRLLPAAAA